MGIQILALDLDGTLLTGHNSVSPACREAVQKARAKGIQAAICTGRNAADSILFGEQAGGVDWAVIANGAQVRSLTAPEAILTDPLGEPLCRALLDLCAAHAVDPCFYTADAVYYGQALKRSLRTARRAACRSIFPNGKTTTASRKAAGGISSQTATRKS